MEVDSENNTAVCTYCGSAELFAECDEAVIKRIRDETEHAKLELKSQADLERRLNKIRKSPLTVIIALLTLGSLLVAITGFIEGYLISAIIMSCQMSLFLLAWLMRMRVVRGSEQRIHWLLTLVAVLLAIPFIMFMGEQHRSYDKYIWPENNLTALLPKPNSEYGEVKRFGSLRFELSVGRVSENDYNAYIEECISRGFVLKDERRFDESTYSYYRAFNESGVRLELNYFSHLDQMDIKIEGIKEHGEYIWSGRGLAALIPEPESKIGTIESERETSFTIVVAETSETDFNRYVDNCIEAGFSEKISHYGDRFSAETIDGIRIIIKHTIDDTMDILVYVP
jgi:hypothetical protein